MSETNKKGTLACGDITASSSPAKGEAGRTGDWRTHSPVLTPDKCIPVKKGRPLCFLCWAYCPDSVITKTIPPVIDLEYCKGCGICAEECPTDAIIMTKDESSEK